MSDTDETRDEMMTAIATLQHRYRDRPDVYVAGNNLIYYQEGDPSARFSPDVYVAFGVPDRKRRTYKLWEEQRAPSFVMEISSRATWMEDIGNKQVLCAHLGVLEYFLYDPEAAYLDPPLQGYRLVRRKYREIAPDPDGSLLSSELGLRLTLSEGLLHFVDAATNQRLLRLKEVYPAYEQAEAARQQAEARAERAEAELVRLQALLAQKS